MSRARVSTAKSGSAVDGEGDQRRSPRLGVTLNELCISLLDPRNAAMFLADEEAYLSQWVLTEKELAALRARDYPLLISQGANIYLLAKLGELDGNGIIFAELYSAVRRVKPAR
jgi:protocatechuate 4,5-dioxygenase alpha subunit